MNTYRGKQSRGAETISEITSEEMNTVIKRTFKKGDKAPGPDGVQGKLLAEAQRIAETAYRGLYDGCLRTGNFPDRWKVGRIVLLRKEGKSEGEASSYRPLCLLNEQGKVMERVIKERMEKFMAEGGKKLSMNQFGFRKGKFTVDAIIRVKELVNEKLEGGSVVLAMSMDIKNAFNSIEWEEIRKALERKKFPRYIQDIIGSYLNGRKIVWEGRDGGKRSKKVERGVPQGSVLGPLLWNITFDSVLKRPTPANCDIVCYADDTLVIVRGGGVIWRKQSIKWK